MPTGSINPVSAYLNSPLRTLYEACRAMGRDLNGQACPTCPVRRLCIVSQNAASAVSDPLPDRDERKIA